MTFRVAAAQIAHETSAFSAVKTDLAAFAVSGIHLGQEVAETARGTNSEFGGFIAGAAAQGFELIPLLAVWATPAGLVTAEAIEHLTGLLGDELRRAMTRGPLDGILLALHGAMVTEIDDDGDGYVLQTVREIVGPDLPVVATLDLHANISTRMVDLADVLIGYDTYPHVDMAERAEEATAVLARLMRGGAQRAIRPTSALRKPPMLPTSQRMTTGRMPMRALMERAHIIEEDPRVINVTIAGGFPLGDNPDAGFGVVVTTNDDPDLAAELANELAMEAWSLRDGFLGGVASFEHAAELIDSLDSEEDVDMPVKGRGIFAPPSSRSPGGSCLSRDRARPAPISRD